MFCVSKSTDELTSVKSGTALLTSSLVSSLLVWESYFGPKQHQLRQEYKKGDVFHSHLSGPKSSPCIRQHFMTVGAITFVLLKKVVIEARESRENNT